jgi:dihydrofolate reductase
VGVEVMSNHVYIAMSLDGYISAPGNDLDWLSYVPIPDGDDLGFADIDAIVMGRLTFETLLSFGTGWTYPVPGIILSSTVTDAPQDFADHVRFESGTPQEIVETAKALGFQTLYIDGGKTIQNFLRADLIDEMTISEIPIMLGGGDRLCGELDRRFDFELISSETLLSQIVKQRFGRKREN